MAIAKYCHVYLENFARKRLMRKILVVATLLGCDLTLTLVVFGKNNFSFGIANLLRDDLTSRLRCNSPQILRLHSITYVVANNSLGV